MNKEAKARIKINKMLENSGWIFVDSENKKANISPEMNVKIKEAGDNFENIKNGFVDYVLLDDDNFPIVVIEAKSEDKNPLDGKEQARTYAKSLNVRFIILSNGNIHYFWDIEKGNPVIVSKFPSLESLNYSKNFKYDKNALINEPVESDYIAKTQNPLYNKSPEYINPITREEFIKNNKLKFLRYYQLKAVQSIQEAVKAGNDRFLFEMATGTGKTLISAAVIKLFLKTNNAKRILFLVDRLELENQADKSFKEYLKNDFTTVIFKENKEDWKKAEIVVTTIQSLMFNDKYKTIFSPNDFDLVISDEAHRSISGNARAVFEYFTGYKLGLTATPKDYIKNIENINERDPRETERRLLLDSYKTFGCENGIATFKYTLLDGVKEKCLINPIVIDARSDITTQLLSDKGLIVKLNEYKEEEKNFKETDFERKFFSENTNKVFCKTFIENALKDPISNETGKTIIFCVSQNHASKITQILNEYADIYFKGKYNSDFAIQVTSKIDNAQQFAINFANNNLNGKTTYLEDYDSCKTRVCVTVGMMTTGYDCPDILNICLLRPIFSPSDFIQIKGRGTRKFIFEYKNINKEIIKKEKERFKLFDFFANCEYFEEKFNYDEVIELPKEKSSFEKIDGDREEFKIDNSIYVVLDNDKLKSMVETFISTDGMKIDRKVFENFEVFVKNNDIIKKYYEENNIESLKDYLFTHVFDKPEEYYTIEKLSASINIDRKLNIEEIFDKIFGKTERFKTKDELLEDEFQKFLIIINPEISNQEILLLIKNFFKLYLTNKNFKEIINKKDFTKLATNPNLTIDDLIKLNKYNPKIRETIVDYVKGYVVNDYE